MTADINTNSNDLGCNLNDLGINGAVTFSRRITPKSEVMEKLSNVPKVVNVSVSQKKKQEQWVVARLVYAEFH